MVQNQAAKRRKISRVAGVHRGEHGPDLSVIGAQALELDLDPRAAEQADVWPGAALAIDQSARRAIGETGGSVQGDVPLDTAAGQKAADEIAAEDHLGPDRAGAAAAKRDDGGQHGGLAGVAQGAQGGSLVVGQAIQGPVRQRGGRQGLGHGLH